MFTSLLNVSKARILFVIFSLVLLVVPINTLAQQRFGVYSSVRVVSLQRTLDAYGKGPFCASCHSIPYPLPPEKLTHQPAKPVGVTEMEPGLRRLTYDHGRDVGTVYSPKENRIVWATNRFGNWTIWIMNDDGSNKKQLTSADVISGWPSWSPDGQEIAYWSYNLTTGTCDIWRMRSDGTLKAKLTTDGTFKGPPMWSPRGDRIAYTANQTGNMEVYIINTDGSGKKQLTTGHPAERFVETRVTWHPDGERLYYQVTTFPLPPRTFPSIPDDVAFVDIFMVNVDTGYERNLTPRLHENVRSVSPDGKKMACISLRSPNYGLWVMNDDGTNQTRLTWDGEGDRAPRFSPDGRKIVYWSLAAEGQPDIWMINVDGSNRTRLTKNSYQDIYPFWSPDGRKIVFESDRAGNFDIWLLSLDRRLDVDVKFESSVTQESIGKALITIKPTTNSSGTLRLEKVRLHFDWAPEDKYVESFSSLPKTLTGPDDVYQAYVEFQVPKDAPLGYHFYDVKVEYSEIDGGVGSTRTYEHSAGDFEVGTPEHMQSDILYKELDAELKRIHTGAINRSFSTGYAMSEGTLPLKSYFEYLLKPDSEYFRKANEEFYAGESSYYEGNYIAALAHFQQAKTYLSEQPSEATAGQTQPDPFALLILSSIAAAIVVGAIVLHNRKS